MLTRLFLPKNKIVSLLFICLCTIFVSGCGTQNSANASFSDDDSNDEQLDVLPENSMENEGQSRGLDMAHARVGEFSFKDQFPNLYELLKDDTNALEAVEAYARQVVTVEGVNSEEAIMDLFKLRDEKIMPLLESRIGNIDPEKLDENWEKLSDELYTLGMSMAAAEGMFTSLGQEPMMKEAIEQYGSDALRLYVRFEAAHTQSMSGEYPYTNMEPYRKMVEIGEKINEIAPNPYVEKIKQRFQTALISLTDVHLVTDPEARQDAQMYVGGASTEAYPNISEKETAKAFADESSESRYGKLMADILENTSEISNRPENIYVIVVEWAETFDIAQNRVFTHLSSGNDVPHYLKVRTGDGKDKYAISYRFFEDADKAEQALQKAKQEFPEAQMIFCSVKGNQLYQLGI